MKSIATELVSKSKINKSLDLYQSGIKFKADQLCEICQTILNEYPLMRKLEPEENCIDRYVFNLLFWCEQEIEILKDGGLI